jgi:hypothetical protein
MSFFKRSSAPSPPPTGAAEATPPAAAPRDPRAEAQEIVREEARRFFIEHGTSWDHQGWLDFLAKVRSRQAMQGELGCLTDPDIGSLLESERSARQHRGDQAVRYRGLTFAMGLDGDYSPLCDDQGVIRGIWYRDPQSIKNEARNRMCLAVAETTLGLKVLDSDYAITIHGGQGGVEVLQNPGGAILWFASAREMLAGR